LVLAHGVWVPTRSSGTQRTTSFTLRFPPCSGVASWGVRGLPEQISNHWQCCAVRAPPACQRAACHGLSSHQSRSRAWSVALTQPEIAHKKQNNDNDTDDSEDIHVTRLVLLEMRKLCAQPGSSRPPGHGLACGALVPHIIETPCNAFSRTSVALASRAICDIFATNVAIVRKSVFHGQTAEHVRLPRMWRTTCRYPWWPAADRRRFSS